MTSIVGHVQRRTGSKRQSEIGKPGRCCRWFKQYRSMTDCLRNLRRESCDQEVFRDLSQGNIRMTSILRGTLAALTFTSTVWLAATPTVADDVDTCETTSVDEAMATCTRAINSGRYSGGQFAALFNIRCFEWNGKQESDKAIAALRSRRRRLLQANAAVAGSAQSASALAGLDAGSIRSRRAALPKI